MRVYDNSVVPAKAGTQKAAGATAPEVRPESDNPIHPVNPDSDEEPVDLVAMAKEIVASLDPSEFEEEPPSNRKPDTTMWDIIRKQPRPVITEEHERIAVARFNEKIERQRLWRESGVKIPTRKDHPNYDDG